MKRWLCLCQTTEMPACIGETSRTFTSDGVNRKFGAFNSPSEVRPIILLTMIIGYKLNCLPHSYRDYI